MRYKELKLGIVTGILCLGLLNGCKGYSCDFHSSEEAQKYVLAKLKDKYKEKFIISEVMEYKEEKIGLNWIAVKVSNKENPSQIVTVYARNTGMFEDNYHVYYYCDEIEKLVKPFCEEKNYIQKYETEIEGHPTSTAWIGKENIEEYLDKAEYTAILKIYLQEGKTDRQYAEEIFDFMKGIMESNLHFKLLVYTKDENPIFQSSPEQHRQSDVEFILEEMDSIRSLPDTMEQYDEWKKQKQQNKTNPE